MKKTKAQKEYHQQMAEINKEQAKKNGPVKKTRKNFKESKIYYYGLRIILILIVLRVISVFDEAIYNIINYYR